MPVRCSEVRTTEGRALLHTFSVHVGSGFRAPQWDSASSFPITRLPPHKCPLSLEKGQLGLSEPSSCCWYGGPVHPGDPASGGSAHITWCLSPRLGTGAQEPQAPDGPQQQPGRTVPVCPASSFQDHFMEVGFILKGNQACALLCTCQPSAWQLGLLCSGQLLALNPVGRKVLRVAGVGLAGVCLSPRNPGCPGE